MNETFIHYYTTHSGKNPVRDFIDNLQKKQKAKILRILQAIRIYGVEGVVRHVSKLTGPLREIRTLGEDNIRIIYVFLKKDAILLIHGFVKKTMKTPQKEIKLAFYGDKGWLENNLDK